METAGQLGLQLVQVRPTGKVGEQVHLTTGRHGEAVGMRAVAENRARGQTAQQPIADRIAAVTGSRDAQREVEQCASLRRADRSINKLVFSLHIDHSDGVSSTATDRIDDSAARGPQIQKYSMAGEVIDQGDFHIVLTNELIGHRHIEQ